MRSFEAVVVGGGIVGSAVGYHLARDGVGTLLVDRADEGRATDAGAGILSPPTGSRAASDPWFEFAVAAGDYYPALAAALSDAGEPDHGYARCGMLRVAVDDDGVAAFERAGRRNARRRERLGVPEADAVEELSPGQARERFPPLGEVRRARYYRDAARVDGGRFAGALRRAGERAGLTVERADAERVVVADGRISGVVADGETVGADAVVVAGGAWSPALAEDLGVALPVEPQRGQLAHLRPAADPAGWPVVSALGHHYLVPWPDGRVVAGATRETGSGFAPRPTAGGVRAVLDEALRVAPGLDGAELCEVRVGLRPVAADGLPVLGAVPGVDGAYLATGHGATGLLLGPYSGKAVADLVAGGEPPADLSAFRPGRF